MLTNTFFTPVLIKDNRMRSQPPQYTNLNEYVSYTRSGLRYTRCVPYITMVEGKDWSQHRKCKFGSSHMFDNETPPVVTVVP